jgi:ABC-2 type transport system ATP-binding protein
VTDAGFAVEIEGVTCRFGARRALDDLTLRVPAGKIVAVVGLNGAGKKTLLDVVCGLNAPDQGRARVFGIDVTRAARKVSRKIGVVPQETALYEEVSARENLRFAAALYGVAAAQKRVDELLALVGLSSRAGDRASALSGGMRRRLCIARALVHDPELLILDEPTVGVDVEARHQIWSHVRQLRQLGRTVLMSTNHLDEAEALADRVAMLRDGKLIAEDAPPALAALAGRCLELDCAAADAAFVTRALVDAPHVLRAEASAAGVTAWVDAAAPLDALVGLAMKAAPLTAFRARSPDLAEVFDALLRRHA